MEKLSTLILACFITIGVTAQSCLPSGIYFSSQSEIDNFKANYPDCTEIEGYVEIQGNGITNLDSLHQITSIGGYLEIYDVPDLVSIEGLSSLTTIGTGRLAIFTSGLENLNGLENLETTQGLNLTDNLVLSSIQGLSSLTSAADGIFISGNVALVNLNGLENLTYTGEGGNIYITENESLTSLSGIDNIVLDPFYVTNVWIHENPLLSECDVASICNFLGDNGSASFGSNATGCNSKNEVRDACGTSVGEFALEELLSIYPNPVLSHITIEHSSYTNEVYKLLLVDLTGQEISTTDITKEKTILDISNIPAGIYFVKIWNNEEVMIQKIVKQ